MVELKELVIIDNKVDEKFLKKIKSAKKAVKLFESGQVEKAYQEAINKAKLDDNDFAREIKISLIEDEQQRNIKIYEAAKFFLQSCQ